jgi:hypothetical protein
MCPYWRGFGAVCLPVLFCIWSEKLTVVHQQLECNVHVHSHAPFQCASADLDQVLCSDREIRFQMEFQDGCSTLADMSSRNSEDNPCCGFHDVLNKASQLHNLYFPEGLRYMLPSPCCLYLLLLSRSCSSQSCYSPEIDVCRMVSCSEKECPLCQHNPSKICKARILWEKYYAGDLMRTKCGGWFTILLKDENGQPYRGDTTAIRLQVGSNFSCITLSRHVRGSGIMHGKDTSCRTWSAFWKTCPTGERSEIWHKSSQG